jgi:hypothetical protein
MWTETTRGQYRRDGLRYASDMTDAEWAMVEPFMPAVKRLGRPRKVDLRGVVEGLLYILRTACPWRLLPHDFPNRSTVQRYFCRRKIEMSPGAQSRDDTPVGGGRDQRDTALQPNKSRRQFIPQRAYGFLKEQYHVP